MVAAYDGFSFLLVQSGLRWAVGQSEVFDYPTLRTADDAYKLTEHMRTLPDERMAVFCLKPNGLVIAIEEFSGEALVEVFKEPARLTHAALLTNASGIVVVRNSADLLPRTGDAKLVRALVKALGARSLHFLDYLVITPTGYISVPDPAKVR